MDKRPACDLVIVDFPDGVCVPGVSDPPTQVPNWNEFSPKFLRSAMTFQVSYLHDDGAFLLFYPDGERPKQEIMKLLKKSKLKLREEWTVINSMHLANPENPQRRVSIHICTQLVAPSFVASRVAISIEVFKALLAILDICIVALSIHPWEGGAGAGTPSSRTARAPGDALVVRDGGVPAPAPPRRA